MKATIQSYTKREYGVLGRIKNVLVQALHVDEAEIIPASRLGIVQCEGPLQLMPC